MGIASLSYGSQAVFRMRTNPNLIRWTYNVNTKVIDTYGGKVVQLLSCNLGDLTVTAECGGGGWAYMNSLALFIRDAMVWQRGSDQACRFTYTTRNWDFGVYMLDFPFADAWDNVSKSFTMHMHIQEDVTGVATGQAIGTELKRLNDGLGYVHNSYNYVPGGDSGLAPNDAIKSGTTSYTIRNQDGTQTTYNPDGSSSTPQADGSIKTTPPRPKSPTNNNVPPGGPPAI